MNRHQTTKATLLSLLLSSLCALASAQTTVPESRATDVKISVGGIRPWYGLADGKQIRGIKLAVKYSGPELAGAKGVRTTVKTATDDAGNALTKKEPLFDKDKGKFRELQKPSGSGSGKGENADDFEVELSFETLDAMKSIKTLAGSIELVLPAKDPGSIVTASFAKDSGKPLKNAALTAAGVEITLQKPSGAPTGSGKLNGVAYQEYELSFQASDPQNKIASVEFLDASGAKLKTTGSGSFNLGGKKTVSASFHVIPPPDAVAKIYLVTDRAVVTVPFELKDIPLPGK